MNGYRISDWVLPFATVYAFISPDGRRPGEAAGPVRFAHFYFRASSVAVVLHLQSRLDRIARYMQKRIPVLFVLLGASVLPSGCGKQSAAQRTREYVGSTSCRECHERFYELWSTSHHAKALQPWSADLAAALPPQPEAIEADGFMYMTHITPERGWMSDNEGREYEIEYAMGGKNYYNFLTLMEDGRLQVLPLLYDVQHDKWKNTTRSMLRHFDDGREDAPVSWRDPMLTFNAECFRCHVSQSESNYDPETDSYDTTWEEPGISCEACHGPSSEHVRVCKEASDDDPPEDLAIIKWRELTVKQQNDSCAGCHTKGGAITDAFDTGDDYWDHYDLATLARRLLRQRARPRRELHHG